MTLKKQPKKDINKELDAEISDVSDGDTAELSAEEESTVASSDTPVSARAMHGFGHGDAEEMEDDDERDTPHDITAIYELEEDEQEVDMTTMDQAFARNKKAVAITVAVTLLVVVVGLVYAVFFRNSASGGEVSLVVKVDNKVASGDVVEIEVTYANNKDVAVSSGTIELFYPTGFTVESASIEPEKTDAKTFAVEQLAPGASGKLRIVGQLVGTKDEQKEFSAQFTYKPENFSQDFQVNAKAVATITSSIIDLETEAPEQVGTKDLFEYTIKVKNTGTTELKNVKVLMEYPKDFDYESSSEKPYAREDEWRYEVLGPNDEKVLKIKGALSSKSGTHEKITVQIGLVEIDNTFNLQTEKVLDILVVNPTFDVTLLTPERIAPGDTVEVKAKIKNTTGTEVKSIAPVLTMKGELFEEQEHTFDTIPAMDIDDEKELTYTTTLKSANPKSKEIELNFTLRVPKVSLAGAEVSVDSKAEKKIRVSGGGLVDAGVSVVDGPVPLVVGEKTTYTVEWTVRAYLNRLSGLQLQTTIPEGVAWENSVTGPITYAAASRQVTLKLDALAPLTTTKGSFVVSVTPKPGEKNTQIVFTNETVVNMKDAFRNEPLSATLQRLTLDADAKGAQIGDELRP